MVASAASPAGSTKVRAGDDGSVAERTTSEYCGAPSARSSENTRVAGHAARAGHRRGQQRDKALVPRPTIGEGIERLAAPLVLRRHPRAGVGGVARLQPPVGIGDLDAVEDIDHPVPAGGRHR